MCTNGQHETIKDKELYVLSGLRETLAEKRGLSASRLKVRDFNDFAPADFVVCTSHVYQCGGPSGVESHRRIRTAGLLTERELKKAGNQ